MSIILIPSVPSRRGALIVTKDNTAVAGDLNYHEIFNRTGSGKLVIIWTWFTVTAGHLRITVDGNAFTYNGGITPIKNYTIFIQPESSDYIDVQEYTAATYSTLAKLDIEYKSSLIVEAQQTDALNGWVIKIIHNQD